MIGPQRLKTARKDGRQVVTLRREESDGQVVVHCEVYPVNSLRVEPIRPGPYVFHAEAGTKFVEEPRGLEYLAHRLQALDNRSGAGRPLLFLSQMFGALSREERIDLPSSFHGHDHLS